jgi:sugar phosphate isomerase/epimerase
MESMLSRRRFLQTSSLAAALGRVSHAKKLGTIGVQLYTVRNVLPEKPGPTLSALDGIGYREAEATVAGLDKIMPSLKATRLKPVSVHLDLQVVLKGQDDELVRTLNNAKSYGFKYAVFPYLPPADRGGLDAIKRLAEKLNRTAGKCRAAGLRFCYHNHAFEFEPMEGTTGFQVLVDNTDKKLVGLELDVFWVSVAGQDPVEILQRLTGRVPLVHLKDKASGTPVMYKESVPRTTFQEVGHGVLDWPKVLRAAEAADVEHYFVEQDQTPGDPLESLRQSFGYLSKLQF